jgi:cyclopropane-fatty-acyl-phospholipid synthase
MNATSSPAKEKRRRAPYDARIVALIRALRAAKANCEVELSSGVVIRVGESPSHGAPDKPPQFRVIVRDERFLRSRVTELSLGRAYVRGDIDIEVHSGTKTRELVENSMATFALRDELRSGTSVGQLLGLATDLAFARPARVNTRAIRHHYSMGDDFYHTFLDPTYHFYSQCMFPAENDDVPANDDNAPEFADPEGALVDAAKDKLDHMRRMLLRPGKRMRILDIGAGWGGLTKYCHDEKLDVEVTSLTLSEDSKKYVQKLDPDAEVYIEDLLDHRRRGYYDAVVIFGVIEHIPTYRLFCRRVWDALKPGGRLYLDASATKQKYAASAFTRHYTWRGAHSCLALPDMIEELLFNGFEIVDVQRGTRDYERTMRAWALRFDAQHELIAQRWGETQYRAFRVFLWGGTQGFHTNRLQAYTLVAERHKNKGPRPGRLRRTAQFAASLR